MFLIISCKTRQGRDSLQAVNEKNMFFNKGLIRHLIIWETLHFQGFNMDMAFWSKWTSFTQRKVDTVRGLCFFTQKVFVHNRVPSKNYIIEDLGQLWGTPVKKCLGAVFFFN